MTSVSIIGNGNMGQAIKGVLEKGASIQLVEKGDPTITGDIVVLAVPFGALDDIVSNYASQLTNKIVVDITNPLNFNTFDELVVPLDSSSAELLAEKLPNSKVLKAFNTTFAGTLTSRKIGELTQTVLIAGNDSDAKKQLADLIISGGLNAVDAGSLKRARELEAVGFLQLTLAAQEKISWLGGLTLIK